MSPDGFKREADDLLQRVRSRCLWYLRPDYCPASPADWDRVLRAVEEHGDRNAFVVARKLRLWLSHNFSAISAGS
jgi:hypothetical protein